MDRQMRALPYLLAAGTFAGLIVITGTVQSTLAHADPAPVRLASLHSSNPAVQGTPTVTDADRRARLEARVQAMLKAGKGTRLTDAQSPARPVGPGPYARQAKAVRQSSSRSGAVQVRAEPPSTFAPPPTRGYSLASLARPRLDLRTPPVVPSNPLECLTQAIYYEARSESEEGQAAVAAVVMNRARSGRYPADVCQVVYQRNSRTCQFTFTCDGSIGRRPVNLSQWARAERIAREVHEGRSTISLPATSVNYHADYVAPTWGSRLERVRQIGAHIFYGSPLKGYRNPGSAPGSSSIPASRGGLEFVEPVTHSAPFDLTEARKER